MPRPLNWRPRKRKTVEAEPADVIPVVAAPRFSETRRPWALAGSVAMLADMTGAFGELLPLAHVEPHCAPPAVSTFSEILSLAMDGFLCERRLKVDPAPYAPGVPESGVATQASLAGASESIEEEREQQQEQQQQAGSAAASEEPPAERVPASPGLGSSEALAPKPAGGQPGAHPVEAFPCDIPAAAGAIPAEGAGPAAARPRAELSLESRLPAVVDEEARLDWLAARHEPGMVRLRSPRVRSPQSARLVKPAAGGSGMPIRLRPGVRPPATGALKLPALDMPRGARVALGFDCSVAGGRGIARVCEPHMTPRSSAWSVPGPRLASPLALDRAPRVPVPVPARALAAAPHDPARAGAPEAGIGIPGAATAASLALPRAPYVEGTIFDPPSFGLVGLELKLKQAADPAASSRRANPAARPVVSYKWKPVIPEMAAAPGAEGPGASRSTRSRMAQLTFERAAVSAPPRLEGGEVEPVGTAAGPDCSRVRLDMVPSGAIAAPGMTTRVFPLSINETPREAGPGQPQALLDQITPKIPHQLRKSPLRTQADWQRSRWASASVYGSAIWRIAIGRFSGALDQAPTPVRWLAAVTALALAAFALLPDRKPAAPDDNSWTIAKAPAISAPAEAAPSAPTPKRTVRVAPPPPQTVPAVAPAPVAAPPVSRRAATRGRRGQPAQTAAPGQTDSPMAGLSSVWDNFQRRLAERSAIAFTDDFRNGLADWEGAGDWARSWSYDASGFVRTGALALLAPARELTDYRMEFLGQIERRSMSWVVRAADVRNYYAIKLTLVGDGPIPEVALIRYPVINGVAGAAIQQTLPLDVRADTVYRVQTEVRGDYFAITVQGKVVDSWTDGRLKRGGVGLFSGKGELARVRWVGVWHQYDTLGRLCALLAPSGLPGRERGVNQ